LCLPGSTTTPAPEPVKAEPEAEQPKSIDDYASAILTASKNGEDPLIAEMLAEVPNAELGNLLMTINRKDNGMGAGFLRWMILKGHASKALLAYKQSDVAYQAQLLEVYERNNMAPVAKELYRSLDTVTQQNVRKNLRLAFPKRYNKVMRTMQ